MRLPRWLSGEESACQCRRFRLCPWVGKIPWRRKWQPTPVFLPGKPHGQRSLVGYSPQGHKRVRCNLATACMLSRFGLVPLCDAMHASLFCPWGFSRQEYWSGLPSPPPEDLPNPGTEPAFPMAPALGGEFFTDKSQGKPKQQQMLYIKVVERVNPKITHHRKKIFSI